MTATAPHHRLTILLADEPAGDPWHEQVGPMLQPHGVQTVWARNGREALEAIEAGTVDVAVLDQQMSQLNGLQVVRLMQELKKVPPAIILTRSLSNQLLQDALAMSVFSVLPKPVEIDLLLDTLARVVRRHYPDRWKS